MPQFTTTDVEFTEYRVKRVDEDDGAGGTVTNVYATAGYTITTQQGRTFRGEAQVELTGTAKTRAGALLQDIKTLIRTQEGLP